MSLPSLASLIVLLTLPIQAMAETQVFESGPSRTAVLELFTSQGCSSCPPADAWLSRKRDDPGLWHDWIPLAWHVDYWNYLGWRDRFSSPDYSDRQRHYRRTGGVNVVYTPGFLLDGKEWTRWRYSSSAPQASGVTAGYLRAEVGPDGINVSYRPSRGIEEKYSVHSALLGIGLETPVASGENSGRDLREDFVVLNTSSGAIRSGATDLQWRLELPKDPGVKTDKTALVVWVSRAGDPAPLQATGGWLEQ